MEEPFRKQVKVCVVVREDCELGNPQIKLSRQWPHNRKEWESDGKPECLQVLPECLRAFSRTPTPSSVTVSLPESTRLASDL